MPEYDVEIVYRGIYATRVYARDKADAEKRAKLELEKEEPDAKVLETAVYTTTQINFHGLS